MKTGRNKFNLFKVHNKGFLCLINMCNFSKLCNLSKKLYDISFINQDCGFDYVPKLPIYLQERYFKAYYLPGVLVEECAVLILLWFSGEDSFLGVFSYYCTQSLPPTIDIGRPFIVNWFQTSTPSSYVFIFGTT